MARRATLRASDSDREFVAERLRQAAAEGRILAEELEARLARALRARTYAELDPLVADLPVARSGRVGRRNQLAPVGTAVLAAFLAVAIVGVVVAVALLVLTGLMFAWGFWLVVAWLFFGRGRRRGWYYGPPRRGPRHQVRYAQRRTLL
jgi:hypothetical protein